MKFEEARDIIRSRIDCRAFLEKSKGSMYCCPFCGSGHGPNGTGAVKVYKDGTWVCFAEPGPNGSKGTTRDVIDLYMNQNGGTFRDAVQALAQQAGITEPVEFGSGKPAPGSRKKKAAAPSTSTAPGGPHPFMAVSSDSAPRPAADPDPAAPALAVQPASAADIEAYCHSCQTALVDIIESPEDHPAKSYLLARGINPWTALAHGVGFDPAADPASAPGGVGKKRHPCPRLIIPSGPEKNPVHYVGRSIDPDQKDYQKLNNFGSNPDIFCLDDLQLEHDEIFVCEGVFDALSVWEVGRPAIALNSASNAGRLIKYLEQHPTKSTLILCLDPDKAGNAAAQTIREGLARLNIPFVDANISGSYKDPNAALTADREEFTDAVEDACARTAARPDNTLLYLRRTIAGELQAFQGAAKCGTGLTNIDRRIRKVYPGLYILAAISSLGKSTLALQIADGMAAQGAHVLYFALEMSRLEMVTKSLSRYTAIEYSPDGACTSLDIREGDADPKKVMTAMERYSTDVKDRISIIEGNFNCDIRYIRDYTVNYRNRNNETPVIIVDYLQILQPSAEGKSQGSKKDEIDLALMELKRLSRELGAVVICVSSVNRANYQTPISFESLKESGGIEYTADVVWGLQLACVDEDIFSNESKNAVLKRQAIDRAKEESPRKIKFVCLKNRFGIAHYETYFRYYPHCDLFVPDEQADAEQLQRRTQAKQQKRLQAKNVK